MPTDIVSTNRLPPSGPGYSYAQNNLTVTVNRGIIVQSLNDDAVYDNRSGSVLINNGTIFSANAANSAANGQYYGVYFQGGRSITNNRDGFIGGAIGIFGDNAPITIINHGSVRGVLYDGVALRTLSGTDVLNNDGIIYGHTAGVDAFTASIGTGNHLYLNHGLIGSDHVGINISGQLSYSVAITNFAGATIRGIDAAIETNNFGHISLTNSGTLFGQIDCNTNERDVVTNHGKITGAVHLGSGNDSFTGTGGTSGTVFGEDGSDTLIGSAHNDTLIGGLGKDTLRGAAGIDHFVFSNTLDSVKGFNHDSIVDFTHAQHDKIDLHVIDANTAFAGDQAFHFIGAAGFHHVRSELRYANHLLQGDTDGNGVADIEIHVNAAQLVAGDFIL